MDENTYLVSQVKNVVDLVVGLAWPVVALLIVAVFKGQIRALVGRVREGEALGAKVKFDPAQAESAVALATSDSMAMGFVILGDAVPSPELADLARDSPALAVVGAYVEVEKALRERLSDSGLEEPEPPLVGMRLIEEAEKSDVVARPVLQAMRQLRRLRNAAAHGGEVTVEKALDYIALCERVQHILELDRGS
jgi:hypothetical protein